MPIENGSASAVTHVVTGKILEKKSGLGIPNLLVELLDLDLATDPEAGVTRDGTEVRRAAAPAIADIAAVYATADRLGSCITDASGGFVIEASPKDFNLGRKVEQKPDLVLIVLAPDEPGLELGKRVLHVTKHLYVNAGTKEAFIIRVPAALLAEREIPFGAEAAKATVEDEVVAYKAAHEHETKLNAEIAAHHGAELEHERTERRALRKVLFNKLATDFERVPTNGVLVAEGDDLRQKNEQTLTSGIAKANQVLGADDARGVPINLYLTSAEDGFFAGATTEFVDIPDEQMGDLLFRRGGTENPGTLLVHNNPITNFCASHSATNHCAQKHSGVAPESDDEATTPSSGGDETSESELSDEDVLVHLERLVRDIPAPERVLRPDALKKPAGKNDVEQSVTEFSLQKGPAEVPAFYDFHSLQIAFDHVWKQLFDETIPSLAYTANTLGQNHFGLKSVVGNLFNNGLLSANPGLVITQLEVPAVVRRFFDVTKEEYNDLIFTHQQELLRLAQTIDRCTLKGHGQSGIFTLLHGGSKISDLRIIQSLTEQGERLIDAVRHDDYTTLHKTLRDLHGRLSGKYEFTVFAADKDYHSVNFGLMNTYRQQWTPLMYQAGRLMHTMPLAPRQTRQYNLKVTQREKRASKEARKNNTSITSEQSSISRVEADIMAKAQNKTTFGLQAEGNFSIGIYEGKGTTTFGTEALSESAQNRKDFREAVLKAVQDYKDELVSEITTESELTSETTESGTISNMNDEVAVTYLFYELQKRYRLSEKLHRVMPVVLVAQQMPSPDQITPAWILTHDWILNRCLLDDSFRPTLRYLANKSVGDDFALRELRKNLRQQRNLVETLRIEFSAASMQADNRYKALEVAIARRIDEENREATDGLLSDVGDFLGTGKGVTALFGGILGGGGGGLDPEAMKARELAAKDAHQYALEKAEKAAAALKQEVATLHQLTDHYNKTLQERLDNETKVKRLLVHIRSNIFYYMQAIWSMEPPDQRYLRLHKVQVPVLELESRTYRITVEPEEHDIFASFRPEGTKKHRAYMRGKLKHNASNGFDTKPLVEVADLDTLLGFKGNYMVFPMKEHNALTEFMAAPYVDSAFGAMDPDELANVSLDEYARYICCLEHRETPAAFAAMKKQLKFWLTKLMATPLRNGDEIVVPTGSLFIESLVDPNPVLEEFKLKHRELDVYKVQEEVRRAAIENLRLAARLVNHEREDPDIDRKIIVEGGSPIVLPQPET